MQRQWQTPHGMGLVISLVVVGIVVNISVDVTSDVVVVIVGGIEFAAAVVVQVDPIEMNAYIPPMAPKTSINPRSRRRNVFHSCDDTGGGTDNDIGGGITDEIDCIGGENGAGLCDDDGVSSHRSRCFSDGDGKCNGDGGGKRYGKSNGDGDGKCNGNDDGNGDDDCDDGYNDDDFDDNFDDEESDGDGGKLGEGGAGFSLKIDLGDGGIVNSTHRSTLELNWNESNLTPSDDNDDIDVQRRR